jgi:hypothetical protein
MGAWYWLLDTGSLEKSARDCHVAVDLIGVDLMRWTLIDHAPRNDMIRNLALPSRA